MFLMLFILRKYWAPQKGGILCRAFRVLDVVTNGSAAVAAPSSLLPLIRQFLVLFLAIKPHHLSFEIRMEFIHNKAFLP